MYQISFYVPSEFSEAVKMAMFAAGAGKIGNYDSCAFESLGTGQFRALDGANPFIGTVGEIEYVKEIKVEMVCEKAVINEAIAAMKKTHPYETPAYHVVAILDF